MNNNKLFNRQPKSDKRIKVFTWHVHGSYLYYLTQANCEFYVPVKPGHPSGYAGRTDGFPWGVNLHEVPVEEVKNLDFDVILYQSNFGSRSNYMQDQYEILSPAQRKLPSIYIEHDPPREHPTDTKHMVDDERAIVVHVTHFNDLMWDCGSTPTVVIDHGVIVPSSVQYTGEIERGIVVINNLALRGRRLGLDIFERVRKEVPIDLIGMGSKELGGLGEVPHDKIPEFISRYRFFFNPIRYTSLGLSVCEAMMIGMPVVGLATTEMAVTIQNDISGYVETDVDKLIEYMKYLISHPEKAKELGNGAKKTGEERFNIQRFAREWENLFQIAIEKNTSLRGADTIATKQSRDDFKSSKGLPQPLRRISKGGSEASQ